MTATPTVPERLLELGSGFTRHHDALTDIDLLRGPDPAGNLTRRVAAAQDLAREALGIADALRTVPRLRHTTEIKAAMKCSVDLAERVAKAADLLMNTAGILQDAQNANKKAVAQQLAARLDARRRADIAARVASLGSKECLAMARLIAGELHRQRLAPGPRPSALAPSQYAALEAVASGHVMLGRRLGKPYVRRGQTRVSLSAIRSLEDLGLVHREPCPPVPPRERVHLTRDGRLALTAALARSRAAAPGAVGPTNRPPSTATRGPAR
ncbi:hypothetical protein [Streptomyces sp. SID8366]|uniref:hypothetical protein n=2 Tax=Streptomyces TaxID=1883 RepID=UPI001372184B